MGLGWRLVRHSVVLLFRNLGAALKVSVGPYLLALLVLLALGRATGIPVLATLAMGTGPQAAPGPLPGSAGGIALFVVGAFVVLLFVSAWVAVAWHRFVLIEEHPGLLPSPAGKPIGSYIWRTLLLALVLLLAAIPVALLAGVIAAGVVGTAGGVAGPGAVAVGLVLSLLLTTLLSWLGLRLGLVLPAVALARPIGMGDSWRRTERASGAIFAAALLLTALSLAASFALNALPADGLRLVLDLALSWLSVMVGISILTTLYGVLVEGRELG